MLCQKFQKMSIIVATKTSNLYTKYPTNIIRKYLRPCTQCQCKCANFKHQFNFISLLE